MIWSVVVITSLPPGIFPDDVRRDIGKYGPDLLLWTGAIKQADFSEQTGVLRVLVEHHHWDGAAYDGIRLRGPLPHRFDFGLLVRTATAAKQLGQGAWSGTT